MRFFNELWVLLHAVTSHPNNRGAKAKAAAVARLMGWQLRKKVLRKPMIIGVGGNRRFKVICDSKFSSMVVYNRLPEWDEMNFLLHYLRAEDGFLDIGANVGFYTVLASSVMGDERIVAIEANARNAAVIHEQVALNGLTNVEVIEVALGNKKGEILFEDVGREMGAVAAEGQETGKLMRVPCMPLDELLETLRIAARVLVAKMDVEGSEGLILEGARKTLERGAVDVWLFELSDEALRKHGSSAAGVVEGFERNGYSILYWDEGERRLGRKGDEYDCGRANYLACRDPAMVAQRLAGMGKMGGDFEG